ncbi:MAG TPA: PilZ domain-containing protein [Polyangia bacterium]|jgi:hypothetical protein|nr:PilZ domain-containing protein [Polyangia bacterium]
MGGWSEQRLEPRVHYRAPVKVMPDGETRQVVGQSLNLSPRGILVDTPLPYPVGTAIVCDVSLPAGSKTLRGRVVRVQPLSPSSTGLGIVFVDLSPADLAALRDLVLGQTDDAQQLAVRVGGTTWMFRGSARLSEDGYYLNVPLPFLSVDAPIELAASPSAPVITRALVKGLRLEPLAPDGVPRLRIAVRMAGNASAESAAESEFDRHPSTPAPEILIAEDTRPETTEVTGDRRRTPAELAGQQRDRKTKGWLTAVAVVLLGGAGAAIALYAPPWRHQWTVPASASPSAAPTAAGARPAAATVITRPEIVPVAPAVTVDRPQFFSMPDRQRATIAVRGSFARARQYPLSAPVGLAVNLPAARAVAPAGHYRSTVPGFREIWIYPLRGGGTHLRFLFAPPYPKEPGLEMTPGLVTVALPATALPVDKPAP